MWVQPWDSREDGAWTEGVPSWNSDFLSTFVNNLHLFLCESKWASWQWSCSLLTLFLFLAFSWAFFAGTIMLRGRYWTCSIWRWLLKPTKGFFLQSNCKTVLWGLPSNALDQMLYLHSNCVHCIGQCLFYTIKHGILGKNRHSTTTSSSCYSHALSIVLGIIMCLMEPGILVEAALRWNFSCFLKMVREIMAVFPQAVVIGQETPLPKINNFFWNAYSTTPSECTIHILYTSQSLLGRTLCLDLDNQRHRSWCPPWLQKVLSCMHRRPCSWIERGFHPLRLQGKGQGV